MKFSPLIQAASGLLMTWDKTPPAPKVPADIIEKTADKYREALRRLTGTDIA